MEESPERLFASTESCFFVIGSKEATALEQLAAVDFALEMVDRLILEMNRIKSSSESTQFRTRREEIKPSLSLKKLIRLMDNRLEHRMIQLRSIRLIHQIFILFASQIPYTKSNAQSVEAQVLVENPNWIYKEILKNDVVQLLVEALIQYSYDSEMAVAGLRLVGALAICDSECRNLLGDFGVLDGVAQIMDVFQKDVDMTRLALDTIHHLLSWPADKSHIDILRIQLPLPLGASYINAASSTWVCNGRLGSASEKDLEEVQSAALDGEKRKKLNEFFALNNTYGMPEELKIPSSSRIPFSTLAGIQRLQPPSNFPLFGLHFQNCARISSSGLLVRFLELIKKYTGETTSDATRQENAPGHAPRTPQDSRENIAEDVSTTWTSELGADDIDAQVDAIFNFENNKREALFDDSDLYREFVFRCVMYLSAGLYSNKICQRQVRSESGIRALLNLAAGADTSMRFAALQAIRWCLVGNSENQDIFVGLGGLKLAKQTLDDLFENPAIIRTPCVVETTGAAENGRALIHCNDSNMHVHIANILWFFYELLLKKQSNQDLAATVKLTNAVVTAMKMLPQCALVSCAGASVLRILSYNSDTRNEMLELNVIELLLNRLDLMNALVIRVTKLPSISQQLILDGCGINDLLVDHILKALLILCTSQPSAQDSLKTKYPKLLPLCSSLFTLCMKHRLSIRKLDDDSLSSLTPLYARYLDSCVRLMKLLMGDVESSVNLGRSGSDEAFDGASLLDDSSSGRQISKTCLEAEALVDDGVLECICSALNLFSEEYILVEQALLLMRVVLRKLQIDSDVYDSRITPKRKTLLWDQVSNVLSVHSKMSMIRTPCEQVLEILDAERFASVMNLLSPLDDHFSPERTKSKLSGRSGSVKNLVRKLSHSGGLTRAESKSWTRAASKSRGNSIGRQASDRLSGEGLASPRSTNRTSRRTRAMEKSDSGTVHTIKKFFGLSTIAEEE
uniref:Uncharacterized protein n=1 Tax=Timspurckia oligopyrenoides TaxID=708627 RepID=A0A7S0ZFA7_9RHOD|mmetsp:Transcript_3020/g.5345  ORF Transcript_3020/g.5345 Transcript_3020/m.5345 type:complete len:968 (+) Transcript_3020:77-2980(+)